MNANTELHSLLGQLLQKKDLTTEQMEAAMHQIMTGQVNDIIMTAFLVALRMKGEVASEIEGAVKVMRHLVERVDLGEQRNRAIDIVGTGGDGAGLFNVSTASAMVVAAAGGYVAKHGSKAQSGTSGSADLLQQAGANLDIPICRLPEILAQTHFCFMFAPNHHKAMKYAATVRTTLAQRTIFNLLGPMTNPAQVKRQLIGCYDVQWLEPLAGVLSTLGSDRLALVHSHDGLDEVSLAAPTEVVEVIDGSINRYRITPEQASLQSRSWNNCVVTSAVQSYDLVIKALKGQHKDAAALIALNAGLALKVADMVDSFNEGVSMALDLIAQGKPAATLEQYVAVANASETSFD